MANIMLIIIGVAAMGIFLQDRNNPEGSLISGLRKQFSSNGDKS